MIFTRSRISITISLIFVVVLAACGEDSPPQQALPTAIVIPGEPSQEPNTDDPTPTQEIDSPTRQPGSRPTLPPTWTPEPSNTPIPPSETPIPDLNAISVEPAPTIPSGCTGFGADTLESQEEITLGQTARIAWRSVDGAGAYWIVIYDASNDNVDMEFLPVIFEDFISNTAYTIPAEVFRAPVRYGWEVRPLDAVGIQMCQGRGEMIIVRN